MTLTPIPANAPTNGSVGDNNSYVQVGNDLGRQFYAQAVYVIGGSNGVGLNGFSVKTGTGIHVGPFSMLQSTGTADNNSNFNTTFSSLTAMDGVVSTGPITIQPGDQIYNVKAFSLTNGHAILAYNA